MNVRSFKLVFICSSSSIGGAELALLRLIENVIEYEPDLKFEIYQFGPTGPLDEKFASFGASRLSFFRALSNISKLARENSRVEIVSWLYRADILAWIIRLLLRNKVSVNWCVRNGSVKKYTRTWLLAVLWATLSRFTARR